jgi:hypothetical protein
MCELIPRTTDVVTGPALRSAPGLIRPELREFRLLAPREPLTGVDDELEVAVRYSFERPTAPKPRRPRPKPRDKLSRPERDVIVKQRGASVPSVIETIGEFRTRRCLPSPPRGDGFT